MKYIDVDKLKEMIDEVRQDWLGDSTGLEVEESAAEFGAKSILGSIDEIITSLQKEQLEVDLKKFTEKIKTFQRRYKYPENVSIKGAMAFMARMFYQYPNVARQWYDGLPKATMDDARKEK